MLHVAYLSLGSNIGNRAGNLREALRLLAASDVQVKKVSSFYETEPVDYLQQDWFLNCVAEVQTELSAEKLLAMMRGIEAAMGSKKAFAKGPRLIDLDILLYDDAKILSETLEVPHPRMLQRKFVLVPLAEIAPRAKHPSWATDVEGMLARCTDTSDVRMLNE